MNIEMRRQTYVYSPKFTMLFERTIDYMMIGKFNVFLIESFNCHIPL